MRSLLFTILVTLTAYSQLFAGGMVHNTNQSATWVRMLVRDASTDIDAVFYNPAGLTKMSDGFHISLISQSLKQTREIENGYPYLNENVYNGEAVVPFLPSAFAAYKKGKIVAYAGFTVVGGGGTATYKKGLPSFEIPISNLVPGLSSASLGGVTEYSADIKFEGSSTYMGVQAGVSYAINEMVSVSVGARYVSAKNTYSGYIKNIMINPTNAALGFTGNMVLAPTYFTTLKNALTQTSAAAQSFSSALGGIITENASNAAVALSDGATVGLTAAQIAQIQGILVAAGQNPAGMNIGTARAVLTGAAPVFATNAATMAAYAASTSDKEVDAEQTGSTFTPIVGVNLSLMEEKLNIGIKYELASKMTMTNSTTIDDTGMFPDGAETTKDMPGLFTIGAAYKATEQLSATMGFHYYTDMAVSYGRKIDGVEVQNDEVLDANAYELGLGLEYGLSDKLALSCGYLFANTSPKDIYLSDIDNSLTSSTLAFGGAFRPTPKMSIDLGFLYTIYQERSKEINYGLPSPITESYNRTNMLFAIGVNYSFGKTE